MLEVAGSLWSVAAPDRLEVALRLRAAGLRRLHWDFSDGRFAAPGGFRASEARAITQATGLAAEAHLMTWRPLAEVDAWTEFCDRVIVHVESEHWMHAVRRIGARGAQPGVAICPGTPPAAVPAEFATLCMGIVPGTAGAPLDPAVFHTVAALHDAAPSWGIGIDGGVKREHVDLAADRGATWLVVGGDLVLADGTQRWADVLAGMR